MAIQYKVVELKGQRDPRSGAGDTPEVTGEDIETALNEQGRDNWELFTVPLIEQVPKAKKPFILRCMRGDRKVIQRRRRVWRRFASSAWIS
jgi:hypothetical protein